MRFAIILGLVLAVGGVCLWLFVFRPAAERARLRAAAPPDLSERLGASSDPDEVSSILIDVIRESSVPECKQLMKAMSAPSFAPTAR